MMRSAAPAPPDKSLTAAAMARQPRVTVVAVAAGLRGHGHLFLLDLLHVRRELVGVHVGGLADDAASCLDVGGDLVGEVVS